MPWSTGVPSAEPKPAVVGWFAIFNILAAQHISIQELGYTIGVIAAAQSIVIQNVLQAKGIQSASQSLLITDSAAGAFNPTSAQSFLITDSAILRGVPGALQSLSITELATVIAAGNAAQQVSIINSTIANGIQQANQNAILLEAAFVVGKQLAPDQFTVTNFGAWYGKPGAAQSMSPAEAAGVISIVLSPQQVSIVNACAVTATEANVVGQQAIPIIDAATVSAMELAGQSFTIVQGAVLVGKSGADQIAAITESGIVKTFSAANVSIVIANSGVVYAKLIATQSFSIAGSAVNNGAPDVSQSISITNFASATSTTNQVFIAGSNSVAGTSISIPAHQVGDLIVLGVYRNNNNALATKPTATGTVPAWTNLLFDTGADTNSMGVVYFKAAATNHTSGIWTNATHLTVLVIRGQHPTYPFWTNAYAESSGSTATLTAPAVTMKNIDGTSILLHLFAKLSSASIPAAPSGYTRVTSVNSSGVIEVIRKNNTNSDGSLARTFPAATRWRTATFEVLDSSFVVPAFVGGATIAGGTTIALPSHQAGDLLLIFASNGQSSTVPTTPAAESTVPSWVDLLSSNGTGPLCSLKFAAQWATSNNHTSGSWANSQTLCAVVVKNPHDSSPIGGTAISSGSGTTYTAPAVSLVRTDNKSLLLHYYKTEYGSYIAWDAAPSGYTRVAASSAIYDRDCLNMKNDTTSDGAITQGTSAYNAGWWAMSIEITPP